MCIRDSARSIAKVLSIIGIETIKGLEEVYEMAVKENLTLYNASYISIAARRGLILVTDDKKLIDKASQRVLTVTSKEPINRKQRTRNYSLQTSRTRKYLSG